MTTQKQLELLIETYKKAREKLLDIIINTRGVGTKVYYNTVLQEVNSTLENLAKNSKTYIETAIPTEYQNSLDELYDYFKKNRLLMKPPHAFAQPHNDAVYTLAREMQYRIDEGLAQAGRQVLRYLDTSRDNALRSVGLDSAAVKTAMGATVQDMKNDMIKQLQAEGFMTVQYGSEGHSYQVSLDTYAAMVSRSTTREAGNLARTNQLTANGYDLVEMTEHYPTCEVCATLQGRVYSISGEDKRFPALSKAFKDGYQNVHPNCRHSVGAWVESMHSPKQIAEAIHKSNLPFEDPRPEVERALYNKQQLQNRRARQDLYQYERYRARLGKDAPGSFSAFRRMKKAGAEKWGQLQNKYRLYNRAIKDGVLPNSFAAATSEEKIKGYLLNDEHPVGRDKAHVINSVLGYNKSNWQEFSDKLYAEVQRSPIDTMKPFTYQKNGDIMKAVKYEIPVIMAGKKGRMLELKTVWQIDENSNVPRFITATFPKKKGTD